jgi:Arc/MetJ-type ribon-helix-helix transcriptional regulator
MKPSSKRALLKKRGRPATGNDPVRSFRMPDELMERIDTWLAHQEDRPSRAEAIRRLVELGLTVKAKPKQPPVERAKRARELAAKAIEKMSDPAATMEERTQRHRRLTKGPLEFREDRVDLPEPKGRK